MNKNLYLWPVVIILIIAVIGGFRDIKVNAEDIQGPEIKKIETKEFSGQLISRRSMGKNEEYIGIAGKHSDSFFKLDKDVQIIHKRNLDDIGLGDTVSVIYDEVTQVTPEGREQTVRIAKAIKFVRKGTRGLIRIPGEINRAISTEDSSGYKALESREDGR